MFLCFPLLYCFSIAFYPSLFSSLEQVKLFIDARDVWQKVVYGKGYKQTWCTLSLHASF